ncbi:acylase [Mucilaginibacter myungsuensis]|uniref:Acylase n=1 Tax=Mucilaginibacter myungsuensis TaxID=649104 RepID=A0A929KRZ7_9SPHI|nr:acylase [Mucilaginibacter myungsuensis]MBE9660414.1 acylase [Mucilaginibacter myungsuensis]MDN3600456.1 acylase [Mucilaginibacter myungsuensis]
MKRLLLAFTALAFSVQTLDAQNVSPTKIEWDNWGVPHITAKTEKELFFAQGWAQMQAHADLILKLYGVSRGRAAEYWGAQYEGTDRAIRILDLPRTAIANAKLQKPEVQQMLNSFAAGMNAYAKAHPEAIDDKLKVVLPVSAYDINMHSLFIFVTRFTGGGELDQVSDWKEIGSNAIAIGPKRSASGKAMLVQNPHLPWGGEFTWFESGLNLNGKLIYGANLVGMPGIGIGFNEYLGWTHTNNTLDNADSFEITLKDGGYLLDGKTEQFKVRPDTIKVKQADGSLVTKPFSCYETAFGPVFGSGKTKAICVKLAGADCPNASLEWWRMATAENFNQFEAAVKMQQIPFWNITYADKQGNIFYLFNGEVPKRPHGGFGDWDKVIKTSSSKDIWQRYLTYDELPKLKNPTTGWLQNTNDPPWTATLPRELDKQKYPAYIAPDDMSLRTQRSVRMLMEDKSITYDELLAYKHSTRLELADRVLEDLLGAINPRSSTLLQECKAVLSKWDRSADNDSRGTILFANWVTNLNNFKYTVPWDRNDPMNTPKGIADKAAALTALEKAANYVKTTFGALDTPWGDYLHVKRGNVDLPGNGAGDFAGIFRVASTSRVGPTRAVVSSGDSYVGVLEFGDKVKAKVLVSYGNSSQKNSPHNGDQLKLFSKKELRDALIYPKDLIGKVAITEIRKGDVFVQP